MLRYILDPQFRKIVLLLMQQCGKNCVIIGGISKPFVDGWYCTSRIYPRGVFSLSGEIWNVNVNVSVDLCFRISCELVGWLTIGKSQALEIVYCSHDGNVKGVVGEGGSVSWGGARTKGELNKRKLTKNMLLYSDLLTSLIYSLTQLCFTIVKLVLRGNGIKR